MEFFASAGVHASEGELQRHLRVENLHLWCEGIERNPEGGAIVDLPWGRFHVHRQVIHNGLRFSLPASADALQWTVTTGDRAAPGRLRIHCTVNLAELEPAREAELRAFVEALQRGLVDWQRQLSEAGPKVAAECSPWFGGFG